jgi:ABC-type uncharacterized transport system permease subunit
LKEIVRVNLVSGVMVSKPANILRLLTHVIGEVLTISGGIFIALGISGVLDNEYVLTGFIAVIIGAFCQWNPV